MLDPEVFYLLLSAEGVSVPPEYAAEMMAYDPTAGELRTHYAGFFDPGFGYDRGRHQAGLARGARGEGADVPFMVEDGQPICKLAFERMTERPEKLYGEDVGSNYQGQETMLSKHFVAQTAGAANPPGVSGHACVECSRRFASTDSLSARAAATRGDPLVPAAEPARARRVDGLEALGIETVGDLLEHLPHSHRDRETACRPPSSRSARRRRWR